MTETWVSLRCPHCKEVTTAPLAVVTGPCAFVCMCCGRSIKHTAEQRMAMRGADKVRRDIMHGRGPLSGAKPTAVMVDDGG